MRSRNLVSAATVSAARSSCAPGEFPGTVVGTLEKRLRRCAGQTVRQRLSDVERGIDGELFAGPELRRGELRPDAGRAPAGGAAHREPSAADRRDIAAGRAAQVHSTAERIEATRAGASVAKQRLDVEQRRFDVGLSTSFLVTQAQRDLLQAEVTCCRRRSTTSRRSSVRGASAGPRA